VKIFSKKSLQISSENVPNIMGKREAVSIRTRDLIIFLQSFFAIIQIQDKQNNMAPWNI